MHMIEIFEDGTAGFAAAKPGWHRLGTVYAGQDGITAEQALSGARLGGWNVRKIASPTVMDPVTGELVVSDDDYMIVRTNPVSGTPERLGMAGNWFEPIQNEEHIGFLQALIDGGAGIDAAMSLYGGKNVVVTMKLPAEVKIGGVDRVGLYIAVINYHDGHGSFTVLVTPIRVVCANTQAAALANFVRKLKIRHTGNATANVEEARRALGLSYGYMDAFQAEAERMINETLTVGQFEKVAAEVFPKGGTSKMAGTMFRTRTGELIELFTEAKTQENCRLTRWAGYQAIVEYLDYRLPVRGATDAGEARAARALMGDVDKQKEAAFKLLRVPA
jgi:phage/plasmid-like protein (TIGR03299 family)